MTTERIYQDEDGQWFFSRRGDHAGPFGSETKAERELRKYLQIRNRKLNSDLFGSSLGLVKNVLRKFAA